MNILSKIRLSLAAVAALSVAPAALAQADWPQQPVAIVMTFPAGSGVDVVGRALHALERTPAVQQEYRSFSEEAMQLGVFGAPTFIVRGHKECWWGQDRLFFVDRFLDRLRG